MNKFWNSILDRSILFSFSSWGFRRHQIKFTEESLNALNQKVLITGGTSGIGFAAGKELADKGAIVHLVGTSPKKGEAALKDFPSNAKFTPCNLGEPDEVENLIDKIDGLDILINNAGSMPVSLKKNSLGEELIFASQVLGHYQLTHKLLEKSKISDKGRVTFVSSGGMYLKKLNLDDINYIQFPYNGYQAYANAKRAQVILNELFAAKYPQIFSCMHPGWVDTPAVKRDMPWFYRLMKPWLRTTKEGADTICWLAMTQSLYPTGRFWFDRREAATHFLQYFQDTAEDRKNLWKFCQKKRP